MPFCLSYFKENILRTINFISLYSQAFPLIQSSLIQLVQLAQSDKTNHAWQFIHAQLAQTSQWSIWDSIRPVILGPGFNRHQRFYLVFNIFH